MNDGHSVCVECKRAGNVCVLVAHGTPCKGPVTQAGCGALCPSVGRGCYGCFGPAPGWTFMPFGTAEPVRVELSRTRPAQTGPAPREASQE